MKKVFWIALLLMVIFVGMRLYRIMKDRQDNTSSARREISVAVEIAPIQKKTLRDMGFFGGSLKPVSGYTISPKVSGRLNKLMVNIGDRVANGQLIAVIDDEVFVQQLEQARANHAVAEAQVKQTRQANITAEANWTAVKNLFDQGYSTPAAMDQADAERAAAKARYDISLAEVQRALSLVRSAEIQLSYTRIKASWNSGPSTRVVGERFVEEGALLPANAAILTLIDYSTVIAEIDVIEKDYHRIRVGQKVSILTDAFPEDVFEGKLARLAPILQNASRQARAEIEIPNHQGKLKPGMFVRVNTTYSEKQNVDAVPRSSIVKRGGKEGVFLVNEDSSTVSFVPIKAGIRDSDFIEIEEPTLRGSVVVLGQDQLQDGRSIKITNTGDKTPKTKQGANP